MMGTLQLSDFQTSTERGISQLWTHNGFNFNSFDWDVAVLKLSSPVPLTASVQPICLSVNTAERINGRRAMVVGWGRRKEGIKGHCPNQSLSSIFVVVIVVTIMFCAWVINKTSWMFKCSGYDTQTRALSVGDSRRFVWSMMQFTEKTIILLNCKDTKILQTFSVVGCYPQTLSVVTTAVISQTKGTSCNTKPSNLTFNICCMTFHVREV